MNNIIALFIVGLIIVNFIFFLGKALNVFTKTESDFKNIVFVIVGITSIFALIKSSFNSYLLILFLFFIYFFIKNKFFTKAPLHKEIKTEQNKIKNWILLCAYFVASFVILNLQLIFENGAYSSLRQDFSFYAAISEILSTSGIETYIIDNGTAAKEGYKFYHYFELWTNGLFSIIWKYSHLQTLMFITIPVYSSIMLLGVFELMNTFKNGTIMNHKLWLKILPISILFLYPFTITFRWVLSFGNSFEPWNPSIAFYIYLKWIIVIGGFIFLLLDYKKNQHKNTILILACIGVVYPTTMLTIIPSLMLWALFYRNKMTKSNWIDLGVAVIIIGAVMWKVNLLNKAIPIQSGFTNPSMGSIIKEYFLSDLSNLLSFIIEPLLRTIYILIAFLPLIILLWAQKKVLLQKYAKHAQLVVLFVVMYLLSIFGIVILDFSYDGDQLHRNIFSPLYVIITLFGFLYVFNHATKYIVKIGVGIFIFTIMLNIIGMTHMLKSQEIPNQQGLENIIKTMKNNYGETVFIAGEDYFKNTRRKNINFIVPAHNLRFYLNNYNPHCLSIDKIKLEDESDFFNLGNMQTSSRYFKEIIINKETYVDVFKNNNKIGYLIIEQQAEEFINAEEVFDVKMLGFIENFFFYKKLN
jgi:hypothetical protein